MDNLQDQASETYSDKPSPIKESKRIGSLDALRGFALLGMVGVHITSFGFGFEDASSDPSVYLEPFEGLTAGIWTLVYLSSEGIMRALFAMLFGAGVVILISDARKGGWLYFRRNFWLLIFGLIDIYLLLWLGDILFGYAVAGMLLWFVRNWSPKKLIILASVLACLSSLFFFYLKSEAETMYNAYLTMQETGGAGVDAETQELAQMWEEDDEFWPEIKYPYPDQSYLSALASNTEVASFALLNSLAIMVLDFFMLMLVGMALFRIGILQGEREPGFYLKIMWVGLSVGLLIRAGVAWAYVSSGLSPVEIPIASWTIPFEQLTMGLGYIGLILWLIKSDLLQSVRARLACVGRMALTNYLMLSLLALLIFSGAGLNLFGAFSFVQLYLIVPLIWLFYLVVSPWWLKHFYFGPLEWVWRYLTYLKPPKMRRQ